MSGEKRSGDERRRRQKKMREEREREDNTGGERRGVERVEPRGRGGLEGIERACGREAANRAP